MALLRPSSYAPDIYKALNGILLVYKPPRLTSKELTHELRDRISDSLNQYKPRPIAKRLVIEGDVGEDKSVVEKPNLADHPLVVGPRYTHWDLSLSHVRPNLGYRSSGLDLILLGNANRHYKHKLKKHKLVSIYHITGRFGYTTDTCFYDGKIIDKASFKHIRTGKLDAALTRIESTQHERLFDSAAVPLDSQKAYELAKAWPSRPPNMANWPVIYRIRNIHLKIPEFKLEVTVANETESFLAQLSHDVGQLLRSAAYTESIRRVKLGPFDVNNSLTDKDWNLKSIIEHLRSQSDYRAINEMIYEAQSSQSIRTQHQQEFTTREEERTSV